MIIAKEEKLIWPGEDEKILMIILLKIELGY